MPSPDKKEGGEMISPPPCLVAECLILVAVHVLDVNGVLHRLALGHRRFGEVLATTELLEDTRTLVFTFELLQGALDVFALFYRHDDHSILCFFVVVIVFCPDVAVPCLLVLRGTYPRCVFFFPPPMGCLLVG